MSEKEFFPRNEVQKTKTPSALSSNSLGVFFQFSKITAWGALPSHDAMGSESWSPMEENGQSQIEEGNCDDECCGADQTNEYDEDSDEKDDMELLHEKNRTLVQRRNVILIIILVTVAIPVAFLLGDNLQQDYYLVRHMSLVGAAWGAACSIVIVWSSHTVIAYNRHPNALLYWRSVCSLGTAMKI